MRTKHPPCSLEFHALLFKQLQMAWAMVRYMATIHLSSTGCFAGGLSLPVYTLEKGLRRPAGGQGQSALCQAPMLRALMYGPPLGLTRLTPACVTNKG